MEFVLRAWRREDIPVIARYANNPHVAENLRDVFPFPYTEADAAAYILDCMATGENGSLKRAIDIDGEAVGSITVTSGADVYRKSAEVGYWLAEPFWGQGIMSEAIRISEEAFRRFDLVRLYAEPFATNTGSRRALETTGSHKDTFKNNRLRGTQPADSNESAGCVFVCIFFRNGAISSNEVIFYFCPI